MKKRILICLLALCLLVSLAACGGKTDAKEDGGSERSEKNDKPASQSGGQGESQSGKNEVTEADFTIVDLGEGCCEVSFCGSEAKKIAVPDTLYGLKVVGIGSYAFNQCPAEEISLPDTVEYIAANAFCLCENMRRIDLGAGLKRIGQMAFVNCNALERVDFPEGMEALESFCFGACEKLGEVYIPASVTEIPKGITNITQCPNIVIVTPAGSVAEQTAIDNGLPVKNP